MFWFSYEPEGDDYIPTDRWGKDHWSTFAYAEVRAVEHRGILGNKHMRCNVRVHRQFAADHHFRSSKDYPTRLKDGLLEKHDDWSCLEDAVAAGLLCVSWKENQHKASRGMVFGNCTARVVLTDAGRLVAAQLRHHKAQGGTWAEFEVASIDSLVG